MDEFARMNAVYAEFFKGHKPARSCVEVARLPLDVLFEIECIASLEWNNLKYSIEYEGEKKIVSIFEICQLLTNHETPTKLQGKDKKRENNISNKSLIALHLFDYSLERRLIKNFKPFFFCHL